VAIVAIARSDYTQWQVAIVAATRSSYSDSISGNHLGVDEARLEGGWP
jgi:hypothetical protein